MSEQASHSQSIEVPAPGAHGATSGGFSLLDKDTAPKMIGLTWITFILMTLVLYKVAWKPILKALDMREDSIRKALADAEKARAETAALEARQQKILKDSQVESQKILDDARTAARHTAETIHAKANQESRDMIESAKREITSATERARAELRKESAELAIAMATKVISENMDNDKNRAIVQKMIKEL
ncbi:MAG: F0F1 ATP synthase subunit B [Kiritimatiellae bacterium]|nr:F0F1 ATP synthase subunit B [Kiritimatiellia bacterium]MDD5520556.1 F0F1 ATP synthase subunit B [Kiritimatiellia bacterium]